MSQLDEIEWYHRLRNQLYHQGNGLTVESDKVLVYSELAALLFERLFDVRLGPSQREGVDSEVANRMAEFFHYWVELEDKVGELAYREDPDLASFDLLTEQGWGRQQYSLSHRLSNLRERNVLSASEVAVIKELTSVRNRLVHEGPKVAELTDEHLLSVLAVITELDQKIIDRRPS